MLSSILQSQKIFGRASSLRHRLTPRLRPNLQVLGITVPAYGFFVVAGVLAGFATAAMLGILIGLNLVPLLIGSISGLLIAVVLAFATRAITGSEVYSFYHYQIAVISVAAFALFLLGVPVLRYVDVLILALGSTHALGRLGCLFGGCCYGRPSRLGICYNSEHVDNGFPSALVGVRLLPIQAIESAWIAATTAIGIFLLVRRAAPGSSLSWYVTLYGAGRFFFEFHRTDSGRLLKNLTEAQVTSTGLTLAIAVAEVLGWLPMRPIHSVAALVLLTCCLVQRARGPVARLLEGEHVAEIAIAARRALNRSGANASRAEIRVEQTSLGLLLSAGRIGRGRGSLLHYSVSHQWLSLPERTARRIAALLGQLHDSAPTQLLMHAGTFHVVMVLDDDQF